MTHGVSNVWTTALRWKKAKDLMFGLNKTMGHVAMASSVCWYGDVLRRTLELDVDGKRMKWRPKATWQWRMRRKVFKVVCAGRCMLVIYVNV